eukprot:TRINITY_DN4305_c0_g1_i1.p1 TRINITY_DN4305_c0_g1~~TRINITY_DN4305_c0_g1_i1.p1  ORF type:complete len:155 (+),score=26.51 TRINITY_DN4305_c0_g1_i1:132-596(+)
MAVQPEDLTSYIKHLGLALYGAEFSLLVFDEDIEKYYEKFPSIGSGSFGQVRLAESIKNHVVDGTRVYKAVAVKQLKAGEATSVQLLQEAVREGANTQVAGKGVSVGVVSVVRGKSRCGEPEFWLELDWATAGDFNQIYVAALKQKATDEAVLR